ncbi:MAG: addiction module protein [Limisphaerales bacterium]|jgi:putative addiction module component (TIGR02574 family)
MTIEAVRKLPRSEKLRLMETLWEDLSRPDSDYQSPAWHAKELAETERRLADGREQAIEWETAKKKLRRQFE